MQYLKEKIGFASIPLGLGFMNNQVKNQLGNTAS